MYIVALVTAKNTRQAKKIAKALLEQKLAACVNIIKDAESMYFWQGKICNDNEVLLMIKSKQSYFKKIAKLVKDIHSYVTPEIIALPIADGSSDYLQWIDDSLKQKRK